MLFSFKDIIYSLGSESRQVKVTACLDEGQVLVARGPSGAGKSTLLRILAKLRPTKSGECFLNKESWSVFSATEWRTKVHLLSQKPTLFNGTVKENLVLPFEIKSLHMQHKKIDLEKAQIILTQLLLPPDILEQDAKTLSGGEAARIVFLRAILIDPDVLLLDEPTASLDEKSKEAFYSVLTHWLVESKHSAIIVSHQHDFQHLSNVSYLDIESDRC